MSAPLTLTPAIDLARRNAIRFPNESTEYRQAREALLAEEIELRRHLERVAAQRRALPPGGEVTKNYRFEGEQGPTTLASLFGDKQTLVTYSYMFGPQRDRPCPMCTSLLSAWDGEARERRATRRVGGDGALADSAPAGFSRRSVAGATSGSIRISLANTAATITRWRPMAATIRRSTCSPAAMEPSATSGAARCASRRPIPARIREVRRISCRSGPFSMQRRKAAGPTGIPSLIMARKFHLC